MIVSTNYGRCPSQFGDFKTFLESTFFLENTCNKKKPTTTDFWSQCECRDTVKRIYFDYLLVTLFIM